METVVENTRNVMEAIRQAAERCGRDPKEVKLLAASKTQSVENVQAAVEAGIRLFGENYVQEVKAKKEAVDESVEWHMIGHLQRNKAKVAVASFSVIESLDSIELATVLDKEGKKAGKQVRTYVEVNLAKEESKTGIAEDDLIPLLEKVGTCSNLKVEGLMVIPPPREDPEEARPFFRKLRELRDSLQKRNLPNVDLKELSMGMTHDYVVAIEEGSTLVRVGTAIFGQRKV
ncbi:MAG: YggS family pyridoxal phosphate-dependent enzyme [Deltaproteobacteria bacterium]|nr:YggS family pyridoxal phosphate-dependent enzyme [Deltaproteobacteria bacterium]